jgi:CO dehydrogenase/acetyl-CoA synthase alpha subunit
MRVGSRWKSTVDTTEVMVIRGPATDVDLRCGGHPMVSGTDGVAAVLDSAYAEGTQVGKRYVDEEIGLELLCSKAGQGTLAVGDRSLSLKDAKPLPTSD